MFLSAFFSSSETAFTAVSKIKLRQLIDQNVKGAEKLSEMLENPKKLITAILIGNNLANVAATVLGTTLLSSLFSVINLDSSFVSVSLMTLTLTLLLLIFGEITPKTLAFKNPEKLCLLVIKPMQLILFLFAPFVYLFSLFSRFIGYIFGMGNEMNQLVTTDEIKSIVKLGEEEGVLEKEEQEMIEGIFDFSDRIVREIMTPRTDAICVNVSHSLEDAIMLINACGHSRVPVYEDKIDNVLGIVYAKDFLKKSRKNVTIRNLMRKATFVPETKSIIELLKLMKNNKVHIAIIVDEYGGMSGLVTMEDIIEEIFGEISDEYDKDEIPEVIQLSENTYRVDAGINIDDLQDKLNVKLPADEDFDTLGGFILSLTGNLPLKNDIVEYENLSMKVNQIKQRRIISLDITINLIES